MVPSAIRGMVILITQETTIQPLVIVDINVITFLFSIKINLSFLQPEKYLACNPVFFIRFN